MKLAIMQPYFFPYIGYFQLMDAVDKIILYDQVSYIKKGWINRNRILTLDGQTPFITVPLVGASSNKLIAEIEVANQTKWASKMLDLIHHNYRKTPFYEEVFSLLESALNRPFQYISDVNKLTLSEIAKWLDLNVIIESSNEPFLPIEKELATIDDGFERKHQRIIKICKQENCNTYVNPIGGMELYDKQVFSDADLNLEFVKTNSIIYQQTTEAFNPFLSIIDVMFNCGKEGTKELITNYELI